MLIDWQGMGWGDLEGNTVESDFLGWVPTPRKRRRSHSQWLTSKHGFCTAPLETVRKDDDRGNAFLNWALMSPNRASGPPQRLSSSAAPGPALLLVFLILSGRKEMKTPLTFSVEKNKKPSHTVSSFSTSAVTFQKRWTKDLWSLTQDASRYRKRFSGETSETVTRNHSPLIPRQRAARALQATAHGWASHSGLLQILAWWCSLCFLPVSVGWNRKLCFKRCGFVLGQHQEAVPGNKRVYSSHLPW